MVYLSGFEIQPTVFPNGEVKIDIPEYMVPVGTSDVAELKVKFENNSDFITLMFIKGFLDDRGIKSNLTMKYFPYSRMDRQKSETLFTLKYVARFINDLHFEQVYTYEAHSDVTLALIDRLVHVPMSMVLYDSFNYMFTEGHYVCYPDAGAAKRFGDMSTNTRILIGEKDRDFATGKINGLKISGDFKAGSDVVIVDDLCSRGGTFIWTASELKKIGAGKIYLVVTHCENTIMDGDIISGDLIEKVITTNSILSCENFKKANGKIIIV